jgi:hypothetical protein
MDEYLLLPGVILDNIDDDDKFQQALACGTIVSHGLLEAYHVQSERRRNNRHYLTHPDLLAPRGETSWQRLYETHSDRAYITTMGVDIAMFHLILESGFEFTWNNKCIPQDDVLTATSVPCVDCHSLNAAGALGLVLHFLNLTMEDVSLMQIFGLIPATVSRYTNFSLEILLLTLWKLEEARIQWPQGNEFRELNELVVVHHPLLTGAFGSLDGLNLPVQKSANEEIENATYNGWLHDHFVSSVLTFSASGTSYVTQIQSTYCMWENRDHHWVSTQCTRQLA